MQSSTNVLDGNFKRKTILMIAFDFPPCHSAGVQRTLKFAEYLYGLGWQPIILTVSESIHKNMDSSQVIPEYIKVYRSASLDASKHFAFKGKYFAWSKVPDKWWTWAFTAIPLGKKIINQYKPSVIWSTYPISTAHFIAYRLNKYSGVPWVADYRDPLQSRYDEYAQTYSCIAKWIERKTVQACNKVVLTTHNATQLYHSLYPDELLSKFATIENGYDEGNFIGIEKKPRDNNKYTILHSGAIYDRGRDPENLFNALGALKVKGKIKSDNFELLFRGATKNDKYQKMLDKYDISDLVEFLPGIPYRESLKEMMSVDGLLVIQGALFNNQIPGKLYEYIRVGSPILGVTPKGGATGDLLLSINQAVGDDVNSIYNAIITMLQKKILCIPDNLIEKFSRQYQTGLLANILETF